MSKLMGKNGDSERVLQTSYLDVTYPKPLFIDPVNRESRLLNCFSLIIELCSLVIPASSPFYQ